MNPKRRKIQRVLEVREKALDQRALELAQSRTRLKAAVDEHSLESERMIAAARRRAELADSCTNVASWVEAEQWLSQKRSNLNRADVRVAAAEATVDGALKGVVEARIDKRRIELLDANLASAEVRRESATEQRLTDELARRRSTSDKD